MVMTQLLEKAFKKVSALPDSEQDALASVVLSELEAIESKLRPEATSAPRESVLSYAGVFRDSREESARIMETIERDCEQVKPEDWQ